MIGCVRFWFGSVRSGDARGGSRGCWGFITRFITAILGGFITRFITAILGGSITRFITVFASVEGRWLRGSLMDSKAMESRPVRSPTY
jgi:hypothetical protein